MPNTLPSRSAASSSMALDRHAADGRTDKTSSLAERTNRPFTNRRKNWTFAGSDYGGRPTSLIYMLIETVKLNGDDLEACLHAGFGRLSQYPLPANPQPLP